MERTAVAAFLDTLTDTQRGILTRLMRGLTWREVGSEMGFTSANVAYHVRRIRREYEAWSGGGTCPDATRCTQSTSQATLKPGWHHALVSSSTRVLNCRASQTISWRTKAT